MDQASYRLARATGSDTEAFHLDRAREAFAHDRLDVDELERTIEHVLQGGYLDENLVLRAPIMDRVRRRRRQHRCIHENVHELHAVGHGLIKIICTDCGYTPDRP